MMQAATVYLVAIPGIPSPGHFTNRGDAVGWLDAERPNLVAAVRVAGELAWHQTAFELSVRLVEYLARQRYLSEWMATAVIGLSAARGLGDRRLEAGALSNLGTALNGTRQYDKAASVLRVAASVLKETGNQTMEGGAQYNLGTALEGLRRFDEAVTAYQKDLAICREVGDRYGEAKTLASLSRCLAEAGRIDEAIAASRDAAAICRKTGDRNGEGAALDSLSIALVRQHPMGF